MTQMTQMNGGVECFRVEVQGVCVFFIVITCHLLFRPSENGLFHPKRSCQHEKI